MSVNLDKFKYDLVEGWREVMDSKNPIDWAIFGYDGQTFDLKLVSKGTNGLDEMVDCFNSGRIMYGLCRVKIKDRNIEKVALINWQGEGAPLARKGTCANHVSTIKHFLKGVHVTINARTEEDVDPDVIRASVAKATSAEGVCMSSSTELDPKMEPIGGAAYKKLNPQEEINAKAKDDFWRKEEVEEENRKKAEKNRVVKFSQKEVKLLRKESQDYFENEQMEKTMTSPEPTPSPTPSSLPSSTNGDVNNGTATPSSDSGVGVGEPSSPTSPTFSNTFFTAEKAAVMRASAPKRNPGENLVRQRIKSFDANPNERPLLFTTPTTNGALRASSQSPAEGEQLSVMKRKAMFESGIVSNLSQPIIRKDPAQEIKSLQEESQNQAKAAASAPPVPATVDRMKSPPPPVSAAAAAAAISTIHHSLPPKSNPSAQPTAVKPQPQANNVKAYNLPFHIGGGVNSRLAEKVNKNSDDTPPKGKINQNGDSFSSSLESVESTVSTASKITVVVQPSTVTVASTAVKAEFQADPIPQHITTNFQPAAACEMELIGVSNVASKSPIPRTPEPEEPRAIGVSNVTSKSPTPRTPEPEEPRAVRTPIQENTGNNGGQHEDTTVQSAEKKKAPSPLPISHPKEEKTIPAPIGSSFVIKPEMGLCARAIYDYQAAEESEITFDPGEIITNIETIDEGWWEGMGPQGAYGLFPSNYVELLN